MNIEAFQQLLRVLRDVAANEAKRKTFSLHDWVIGEITEDEYYKEQDLTLIPHNCNTSACACGYAGLDSWFRENGFITTRGGSVSYQNKDKEHFDSWDAVMEFFNIDDRDALALFSHDSYRDYCYQDEWNQEVTVEEVINKVEDFIKCHSTQCI